SSVFFLSPLLSFLRWLIKLYLVGVTVILAILTPFVGGLVLYDIFGDPYSPRSVRIDTSSEWGGFLLAETGHPAVLIEQSGPHRDIESFSLVGAHRPEKWFTDHGFIRLRWGTHSVRHSSLSGLREDGKNWHVLHMNHPKAVGSS